MCEMWRVYDSHAMKETPAPLHPGTQHPLAPQIKNPRMCIMQKMLPTSKGWDSSPFARAPASEGLKFSLSRSRPGFSLPAAGPAGQAHSNPPQACWRHPAMDPFHSPSKVGLKSGMRSTIDWCRTTRQPRKRPSTPKPKGCSIITNFVKIYKFWC